MTSRLNPKEMLKNGLQGKKPGELTKMLKEHGFIEGEGHVFTHTVYKNISCKVNPAEAVHGAMAIPVARQAAQACLDALDLEAKKLPAHASTDQTSNWPEWLERVFSNFTIRLDEKVIHIVSKPNGSGQRRYTVECPAADKLIVKCDEFGDELSLEFAFNPHDTHAESRFRKEFGDLDEVVVSLANDRAASTPAPTPAAAAPAPQVRGVAVHQSPAPPVSGTFRQINPRR